MTQVTLVLLYVIFFIVCCIVIGFAADKKNVFLATLTFCIGAMIMSTSFFLIERGSVTLLSSARYVVYTVTGIPDATCLRAVNIKNWNKIYLTDFDASKIRGGCAAVPARGIPFKLVEGTGSNDLIVVLLNKESAAAAAKKEEKK